MVVQISLSFITRGIYTNNNMYNFKVDFKLETDKTLRVKI